MKAVRALSGNDRNIVQCREGDNVLRSGDLHKDGYENSPQMEPLFPAGIEVSRIGEGDAYLANPKFNFEFQTSTSCCSWCFTISIGNERRSSGMHGTIYLITPVRHEAADAESDHMPLAMPCLVPISRHGRGSVARHEHRAKTRPFFSCRETFELRAQYIRVLFREITQISYRSLALTAHAMDLGASTPFLWAFEEREKLLEFYERVSRARMHASFIRPNIDSFTQQFASRIDELEEMSIDNLDIGTVTPQQSKDWGFSEVLGYAGICEKHYDVHYQLDPDIPVGTRRDLYDRYCIRIEEIRQSVRIIVQCINQMPSCMINADDRKLCPPSRSRMKLSME
uniref:NADH-quinone oxidoreductase subunit D domain-containing protein n=1 Tax=Solanum lycopersicum TaxID=4081 RepID=A0A3Q7J807_SOLLC